MSINAAHFQKILKVTQWESERHYKGQHKVYENNSQIMQSNVSKQVSMYKKWKAAHIMASMAL